MVNEKTLKLMNTHSSSKLPEVYNFNKTTQHLNTCSQTHSQKSEAFTMKSSMPVSERRRPQPSNVYNVFFTLERFRLIDTMADASSSESETNQQQKSYDLDGYESLALPDIPPRYQHLQLPIGWFVPGKNSKRKHTKSENDCELYVS